MTEEQKLRLREVEALERIASNGDRVSTAVETLCSQFAMLLQVLMQDPDASDVEPAKPLRTLDEPLTPA